MGVGGRHAGVRGGLTYMRWEGSQGGERVLWVRTLPLGEVRFQGRASLVHRHWPAAAAATADPSRLPALGAQGGTRGGGVGVVGRGLIDTDRALPPQRRVLALQRLQLKRDGGGGRRESSG